MKPDPKPKRTWQQIIADNVAKLRGPALEPVRKDAHLDDTPQGRALAQARAQLQKALDAYQQSAAVQLRKAREDHQKRKC